VVWILDVQRYSIALGPLSEMVLAFLSTAVTLAIAVTSRAAAAAGRCPGLACTAVSVAEIAAPPDFVFAAPA